MCMCLHHIHDNGVEESSGSIISCTYWYIRRILDGWMASCVKFSQDGITLDGFMIQFLIVFKILNKLWKFWRIINNMREVRSLGLRSKISEIPNESQNPLAFNNDHSIITISDWHSFPVFKITQFIFFIYQNWYSNDSRAV